MELKTRGQMSEVRSQKSDDRRQRIEVGRQRSEKTEGRRQKAGLYGEKCGKSGKGEKSNYVSWLYILSRFSLPREMSAGPISLGSPV